MANKKRLIDANKTMNSIVDLLELAWGYDGIREDVQQIFENAETVDAVEVVRCRDCKHRYSDSWCEYVDDNDNFYCAKGERKDGDK